MTRDEEIEKKARQVSYNGDEFSFFILGAEWADEHPKEEWIYARKEYIKKIVRIFNENFHSNDGAIVWLETDEDYEDVAKEIIELEKLYDELIQ